MLDEPTRSEIDKLVERLLSDAGCTPPVNLSDVLRHLEVDLDYYSLDDPGLIRRFVHRARVRGQEITDQIRDIVKKVRLHALWCPDDGQIFIDQSIPAPKQRWAAYHDATHRLLPWHRDFFRWDTAQTLDHSYQEMLEAEANYGGSALMFCGSRFRREVLDTVPAWASVRLIASRYKASLTATLRRYVSHGHDLALVAVVSTPRWAPLREGLSARHRHVDVSARFEKEFGAISPETLGAVIDAHTWFATGGSVGDFECQFSDLRGQARTFRGEVFFNQHDLLTLFIEQPRSSLVGARRGGVLT